MLHKEGKMKWTQVSFSRLCPRITPAVITAILILPWIGTSAPILPTEQKIAIFPFKEVSMAGSGQSNQENWDGFGVGIAQVISAQLAYSAVVTVDTMVNLLAPVPDDCSNASLGTKRLLDLCTHYGVAKACIGHFFVANSKINLTVRTFNSRSGNALQIFQGVCDISNQDIYALINEVVASILASADTRRDYSLQDASAGSQESDLLSLMDFGKGYSYHFGIGRLVNIWKAKLLYEKSLKENPGFELAARYRSIICTLLDDDSLKTPRSANLDPGLLQDNCDLTAETQMNPDSEQNDTIFNQDMAADSTRQFTDIAQSVDESALFKLECERIWWPRNLPLPRIAGVFTQRFFYPDGAIAMDIELKDGLREGMTTLLYQRSGQVECTISFHKNQINGPCKLYYENGALRAEATFCEGKKESVSKVYYPTGVLQCSIPYVHGKRHGVSYLYFENGEIAQATRYRINALNGTTVFYYPDGKIHAEMEYNNNVLDGISALYDRDGALAAKYIFAKGSLLGRPAIVKPAVVAQEMQGE
jgi:antitoxin component YwqK of YwqJK toxin-antitoxin module